MIRFFDYTYYRICLFYDRNGDGKSSGISALILLTVVQIINLTTILGILFQLSHIYLGTNKFLYSIPYFVLLILNGFYYNKYNYDVLKERWKDEDIETQKRKGVGVLLYIVLSGVAIIALIIWRANSK